MPFSPRPALSRGGFCSRTFTYRYRRISVVAAISVALARAVVASRRRSNPTGRCVLGHWSCAGTTQQVAQQGGEATIRLQGDIPGGTVEVQVATDPSAQAVGVNLPAVNQTVTFPGGQA